MRCFTWTVLLCSLLLAHAARASQPRVVLIGVDGVSLNLLEPMAQKGITPNLTKLMAEGARGDLASFWPLRTPQVWTSMVTGKLPGQHGIWDHSSNTYFNPPEVRTKQKVVVTTGDRKSKALWNILAERGLRSLTVGWVPSWPAEDIGTSIMVAPIVLEHDRRQTTIKGSFWRDAEGQVYPQSLWPTVRSLIVEPKDLAQAELAVFADIPPANHALFRLPYLERYVYGIEWSLARAKSVEQITLGLLPKGPFDLVSAYFQCTDSLLHRFWIFSEGEAAVKERFATHGIDASGAAELVRRFGKVVEACYADVDARVGKLLAATRGPNTLVVLVSDHGFGPAEKPHRLADEPYSGAHRDEGVVVAVGPGIPPGSRLSGVRVVDIAPSILVRLGLPVGGDMVGKPQPELAGAAPVQSIPSYEATPQTTYPYAGGYPERPGGG